MEYLRLKWNHSGILMTLIYQAKILLKRDEQIICFFYTERERIWYITYLSRKALLANVNLRGKIWICKCHSQYINISSKILKFRLWEQNYQFWRSVIQFHYTEVNSSKVTYSYSNCFLEITFKFLVFIPVHYKEQSSNPI